MDDDVELPRALATRLLTRKPPVHLTHLSLAKFWLLPDSDSFPFTVSQLCPFPFTIFFQSQSCSKEMQNVAKTNSQTDLEKNRRGLRTTAPGEGGGGGRAASAGLALDCGAAGTEGGRAELADEWMC